MDKIIENLINLMNENPEMPVMYFVNYEVCADDEHQYWLAKMESVGIEEIFEDQEGTFYLGKDQIIDHLEWILSSLEPLDDMPETQSGPKWWDYLEMRFQKLCDSGQVKNAIIVKLGI